ncbi:UDP-N-acetylglucosamine 2-epimerase (hydrolyzing) [SAR202 cluster bacterium AD-802-F09_MRT_200m]|nr:UDP-N-acetylglucosamine 2-epimerase (hydrolyzing) [SAR202 cluster bacterium AD-802-F09_MRT_200m]
MAVGHAHVRTVGVVTVARSDYGIYLPILRRMGQEPELRIHLIVSGMHLSPEFGLTVNSIEDDGFEIGDRVEMLLSSDTPEGIAKSMAMGTMGFAQSFSQNRPDILLVLGDRFEMHSAAVAALPFNIPVAHIHGGEITEGAMDDALRHSMTKLSHLHFVSTQEYRDRVLQMGEEPWRVILSGAPSLDNLHSMDLLETHELAAKYGLNLNSPPLLVTFHPVTLEQEDTEWHVQELLAALEESQMPLIITHPNADTQGRLVARMLRDYVDTHANAQMIDNLGTRDYFSLMTCAAAVVGNSSSGIIEAPSFGLPVVNIGTRQQGRVRSGNVIDIGHRRAEILESIKTATGATFRATLENLCNPYGDGHASDVIVKHLGSVSLDSSVDSSLIRKRFVDGSPVPEQTDPAEKLTHARANTS